ncbi:hypothetical protein [Streptomyces sp. NPDC057280]|uniref:hypothetical protein n=1 Tax=Streptomyces sp. NPDC057280 TaxID=3346081 RepID=UPI00362571FF
MSNAERTPRSLADGRALYRKYIGPLAGDGPAEEFARLDDTRVNRMVLANAAARGGERGRAARAQLDKWEAGDSSAA